MDTTLTVSSQDSKHARDAVGTLKRILQQDPAIRVGKVINNTTGNDASFEAKVEPVALTAIALAFVSGGAAKALIDAIRAVLRTARDSDLEFTLTPSGGGPITFKASHLTGGQVDKLLEQIT